MEVFLDYGGSQQAASYRSFISARGVVPRKAIDIRLDTSRYQMKVNCVTKKDDHALSAGGWVAVSDKAKCT